jgi:hypothetical protein
MRNVNAITRLMSIPISPATCGILRGRPHRGAQPRAVHEQRQAGHHDEADSDDGDLHLGHRGAQHRVGLDRNDLRKREHVAAPHEHREMLQDDRNADRGDERREAGGAPQRPVGEALHRIAHEHANGDRAAGADQHDTTGGRPAAQGG